VRPLPGARDLVLRLRNEGLVVVIATSARKSEMRALLEVAGVDDLDLPSTSSDDAGESKPEPDIVHVALARGGCRPREAILIGDTPYDIQAASKAGVGVVAFRSGGFTDAALAGAIAIYDGPADLLARFASSPLARGNAP
jgi:HAD superfamily hydrolase (TIGR01509 family)